MRKPDIMHANGEYWVGWQVDAYVVYRDGPTNATSESVFHKDADGLSIAIARCEYLARLSVVRNSRLRPTITD